MKHKRIADKCLVVLSGGQDSTTCLFWAMQRFDEVFTITFDYGQRHKIEIQAAEMVARLAGLDSIQTLFVKLGDRLLLSTSPLTEKSVELEQYDSHEVLPDGLEKTFVPMRNQLFLTIAANRAYALGINNIVAGVCEEDSGGYPDCRRQFINAFQTTSSLGTFTGDDGALRNLTVHTPLMSMTKAASVYLALSMPGCYDALAYTHTSYDGQYPPTGHDHATLLREKGFIEAGVPDPLIVRAVFEKLIPIPDTPNYSMIRRTWFGDLAWAEAQPLPLVPKTIEHPGGNPKGIMSNA